MAQSLVEQVMTAERALGERMIESALVIVRSWMNELGDKNQYEDAHASISKQYNDLFSLWLTSDDQEIDELLNSLTGEAYQLVDAVYADLRLKRGLSPDMHGFNQESPLSIMNYFLNCVRMRPEDLEWVRKVMNDSNETVNALMAVTALSMNLRECFNIDAFLLLIEGMNAENKIVATQCIGSTLTLLIHYDIRIDYFRQIQDAFVEAVQEFGDGGIRVLNILCSLVDLSARRIQPDAEHHTQQVTSLDDLPKALQTLIDEVEDVREHMQEENEDAEPEALIQWYPASESDYMKGLFEILPDTWVFDLLTADNPEFEKTVASVCLKCGYRDFLWLHPDVAEKVFREKLRKKSKDPMDYINYAHCLLLKGDRMMAVENYRQARSLCKNVKDFYNLFRPDRAALAEKGVPLEHVYMIEDQLFQA